MTTVSKDDAMKMLRRTRGPDVAASVEKQLPDSLDTVTDAKLLGELGLTRTQAMEDLGSSP